MHIEMKKVNKGAELKKGKERARRAVWIRGKKIKWKEARWKKMMRDEEDIGILRCAGLFSQQNCGIVTAH